MPNNTKQGTRFVARFDRHQPSLTDEQIFRSLNLLGEPGTVRLNIRPIGSPDWDTTVCVVDVSRIIRMMMYGYTREVKEGWPEGTLEPNVWDRVTTVGQLPDGSIIVYEPPARSQVPALTTEPSPKKGAPKPTVASTTDLIDDIYEHYKEPEYFGYCQTDLV